MKENKETPSLNKIRENTDVFKDSIAFIEEWDFSTANRSHQDRLTTVTSIASICYAKPDAIGSEKLYNRLAVEGAGIPSSSFGFVPVLLNAQQVQDVSDIAVSLFPEKLPDILIFGELVQGELDGSPEEIRHLTNLRALLQDLGWTVDMDKAKELSENYFNTSEEDLEMIKKYFKVYKTKMDISTSKQWLRHWYILQEISRRYVSDSKVPFEFYVEGKLKDISALVEVNTFDHQLEHHRDTQLELGVEQHIKHAMTLYRAAIDAGVAPQSARRILPQMAYTTIWTAMMPRVYENMLKLRTKPSTQWEFRQLAQQIAEWDNWTDSTDAGGAL